MSLLYIYIEKIVQAEEETSKKKKGMPRWTAYLLWSTRKRREVVVDNPDWTFAQIAKWISEEWKKVSTSFPHDV